MNQIHASIVLYNNDKNQVEKVIKSFLSTTYNVHLYLIDNSIDNSLSILSNLDARITYIFIGSNLGYGKAHNIAIKKSLNSNIPYHIVLNPDVWFSHNVIEELFQYMQNNPDVGNVMPKILYGNGEEQYLCKLAPTPLDLIFRRFLPEGKIKEQMKEKYELRFTGYDKIMEVPILSGCFMFLRTKSLEDVGLFDDRYFMYLEDVDLSRRIHSKYKTIFYPDVTIYHGYAKESYANPQLLKYHIKSAISYFNKWGWFFDKERSKINKKCLHALRASKYD